MKKSSLFILICLIVLSISLFSVGGYYVYKDLKKEKEEEKKENTNENNTTSSNDYIITDDLNKPDDVIIIKPSESDTLKTITIDEFRSLVDNKEDFIILFSQTGCGHCILFKPVLESVVESVNKEILVLEVDLLEREDFNYLNSVTIVRSTPILAFFRKGEEDMRNRLTGEKTKDEVINKFKELNITQ